MRKMLVAGVISTIALIGTAVPAIAQPPGQEKNPEAFVCDGEDTLIVTAGRNGWIDDTKYHAVTFSIEGTLHANWWNTRAVQRVQDLGRGQGRQQP